MKILKKKYKIFWQIRKNASEIFNSYFFQTFYNLFCFNYQSEFLKLSEYFWIFSTVHLKIKINEKWTIHLLSNVGYSPYVTPAGHPTPSTSSPGTLTSARSHPIPSTLAHCQRLRCSENWWFFFLKQQQRQILNSK